MRNLILTGLLLIGIALISGCVEEEAGIEEEKEAILEEPSPQDQITKACEEITDDRRKTECYLNFATEINDPGFCEQLTDTYIKDLCYMGVAAGTRDSSLCEKITGSTIKDACYINVAEAIED